ncbi:putative drug resistance efflux protein [Mycolicibacterium canariasense]|uniref:Putative drug resistance efflux protein n=1 Tax=Mycolicibacterium canariasense TaxID=228230 RepID=A0A100WH70_MYCCR|nr:MFS transporter [Mycolicibacterium canariasense]MCV7213494.1 MFS transporter [Mycolicibacterium canariasense]ORV03947.1 hypothetical protein AWB94_23400 [Mycolicibacterium canariasense]GAS98542.1 putative drug resistance efflux protein [Mycolicibacterium canariasense]
MQGGRWRTALILQTSLVQASWTGVRLMIGYRALAMGADPLDIGLLAASFALPALLGALPAGRRSDQAGGPIVALAGLVLAVIGTLAALVIPGLVALLACAGAIGLGQIVIMIGQQTFVAHASADGDKDAAFGTLTAAASVGQLIGPPLVTVAASVALFGRGAQPNTSIGLAVCAALLVVALPIYIPLRNWDRGHPRPSMNVAASGQVTQLLKVPQMWRSLVVSGAILVSVDMMYAFVPVWATDRGVSATVVGLLLALRAAVTVASRIGLSRLVQRFGRRLLITASIGAAVVGLVALPFVGAWGAVGVMFALGVGLGIPQPLTMSWVTSLTPAGSHGVALGMRLTSNRVAQTSVPLAIGALAGPFGVIGIFWANALILLGAMGVMASTRPSETGTA